MTIFVPSILFSLSDGVLEKKALCLMEPKKHTYVRYERF